MQITVNIEAATTKEEALKLFRPVVNWMTAAHAQALLRLLQAQMAGDEAKIQKGIMDVEISMEAQMALCGIELWVHNQEWKP